MSNPNIAQVNTAIEDALSMIFSKYVPQGGNAVGASGANLVRPSMPVEKKDEEGYGIVFGISDGSQSPDQPLPLILIRNNAHGLTIDKVIYREEPEDGSLIEISEGEITNGVPNQANPKDWAKFLERILRESGHYDEFFTEGYYAFL